MTIDEAKERMQRCTTIGQLEQIGRQLRQEGFSVDDVAILRDEYRECVKDLEFAGKVTEGTE